MSEPKKPAAKQAKPAAKAKPVVKLASKVAAKPAAKAVAEKSVVAPKPEQKAVEAKVVAKTEAKPAIATAKKPTTKKTSIHKAAKKAEKTGRNMRKTREGLVVSNKMDKTIVVKIETRVPHPLYKKVVTRSKNFKAHDEKNECSIGDRVEIAETRPLSKDKYFRLVRIIEKVK